MCLPFPSLHNVCYMFPLSTALEGLDYVSVTKEIVFTKYSQNPHRLYIPIINDCDCVEEYEYFSVNITTYMDCVHLPVDYVTVTILDDDREFTLFFFALETKRKMLSFCI